MPRLDLPVSPHTTVFRAVVQVLRNDPILKATLRGNLLAWEGRVEDTAELSVAMAPAMRATPMAGPSEWQFPEAFKTNLFINFELLVAGTNYDDLLNLWWAVKRALYPKDYARQMVIAEFLRQNNAGLDSLPISTINPTTPEVGAEPPFLHANAQLRVQCFESLL